MSTQLPFLISPEAIEHIRMIVRPPFPGRELVLTQAHRTAESTADGDERFSFDGEHFVIHVLDPGQKPSEEYYDLLGHRLFVVPYALRVLRGRTLTIQRVLDRSGEPRYVFIAAA